MEKKRQSTSSEIQSLHKFGTIHNSNLQNTIQGGINVFGLGLPAKNKID